MHDLRQKGFGFLSDEGPTLKTLHFAFYIGRTPQPLIFQVGKSKCCFGMFFYIAFIKIQTNLVQY